MPSNRSMHIALLPILVVVFMFGCSEPNQYQPPPPPAVTIAKPMVQDVTIYLDESGQTESVDRAEVRARVQGFLEKINFEPGADVSEGDLLYVIERRQYQAALDSANAALSGAQAALSAAQAETKVASAGINAADADLNVKELTFQRLDRLLPSGSIAQQDWDDAKAARDLAIAARDAAIAKQSAIAADVEQAQAQVKSAEADVRQAGINLDYTEVKSPISGRITKTDLTRGNLVENGTLLATVVTYDPIWANFNISERDLLRLQRSEPDSQKIDVTSIKAYLQRSGDEGFPYEGHWDYIGTEVDLGTGTLPVRAVFDNSSDKPRIIPGLFVRIRVPIGTLSGAILIPEQAVARDQAGAYAIAVGSDNVAQRKNVVLGNKQGRMIVVSEGLSPEDSIVVVGLQRARPGGKVAPKQTTLTMASSSDKEAAQPAAN